MKILSYQYPHSLLISKSKINLKVGLKLSFYVININAVIRSVNKYTYITYGLPFCERSLSEAHLK